MKPCPYCAEQVQDEAVLCRFCGRSFDIVISPKVVGRLNRWLLAGAVLLVALAVGAKFVLSERTAPKCAFPSTYSQWLLMDKAGCDVPPAYICDNFTVGGALLAAENDPVYAEARAAGEVPAIMSVLDMVKTYRRRAGCPGLGPVAPSEQPPKQSDTQKHQNQKPGRTLFDSGG